MAQSHNAGELMTTKTGLLLLNLGTPNSPSRADVRTYLKEFLNDPRVVDLPTIPRWLLLQLFILPFRSRSSSRLYQSIWTETGSPLLTHGMNLCHSVQEQLNDQFIVSLGMRYGNPSIEQAVATLLKANVSQIIVLPLFPQYSSAATGSAVEKALTIISAATNIPSISVCHDFYNHPAYSNAMIETIQPELNEFSPDYLLLSYHGLPERQIKKSEDITQTGCDLIQECPRIQVNNRFCYRAQCYETTHLLREKLNFPHENIGTSFQSRLGKTPWIKPYTDEVLTKLAKQGIKRLAIACPSFVADCLETLEEIAIRAKEQWLSLGGQEFRVIPCLNSHPAWVKAVVEIARQKN